MDQRSQRGGCGANLGDELASSHRQEDNLVRARHFRHSASSLLRSGVGVMISSGQTWGRSGSAPPNEQLENLFVKRLRFRPSDPPRCLAGGASEGKGEMEEDGEVVQRQPPPGTSLVLRGICPLS